MKGPTLIVINDKSRKYLLLDIITPRRWRRRRRQRQRRRRQWFPIFIESPRLFTYKPAEAASQASTSRLVGLAGQVYHENLSFFWHVELVTAQEEVEPEILENITTQSSINYGLYSA